MGKFLKKNWFVLLIIVIFAGISTYYIYDTNKGKLKGKKVDGEDVVYSISDEDVTATEFYDELTKSTGSNAYQVLFQKAVADASYKTTKSIRTEAESQASSIQSNYSSTYGSSADSQLASDLASSGYSDLTDYLITQIKLNKVTGEYAAAHFDELKIRKISYILIQFEDSSNVPDTPTADEQSRMDAVDKELDDGTDFADVATDLSEDTSTASNGGVLGIVDVNSSSSLDSTFLDTALSLDEGEVSDWVKSDSFGYFKIKCDASTPETLEADDTYESPYETLVTTYDTSLQNTAVWAKAQDLGIDFNGNDDIEKEIKAIYGADDEEDTEASASPEATSSAEASASAESTAESTAASTAAATAGGDN